MLDTGRVAALQAEGLSLRQIAAKLGASLGAVQRALARRPPKLVLVEAISADDDADDDPWAEAARLEQLAAVQQPDPSEVVEPVTYVGEDDGGRRYLDANGRSLNALGWYRFRMYIEYELEDPDRAERVDADMDRQIEAYEAAYGRRR